MDPSLKQAHRYPVPTIMTITYILYIYSFKNNLSPISAVYVFRPSALIVAIYCARSPISTLTQAFTNLYQFVFPGTFKLPGPGSRTVLCHSPLYGISIRVAKAKIQECQELQISPRHLRFGVHSYLSPCYALVFSLF